MRQTHWPPHIPPQLAPSRATAWPSRHALALAPLAMALSACGPESVGDALPFTPRAAVIQELRFGRVVDNVSPGFDLDGEDGASGSSTGCGIADYASPEGASGIDNSFGPILPILEAAGAQALEELIQAAINGGELMILFRRWDDEDLAADTCFQLDVGRAMGAPMVGGNERLLSGQTFEWDPAAPSASVDCATADADGVVLASDLTIGLPLQVFDESIDFTLLDGRVQLNPDGEGGYTGLISGGVSVEELKANVESFDGIGDVLPGLIASTLDTRADLRDETGTCARMSVVMEFQAASAWIY